MTSFEVKVTGTPSRSSMAGRGVFGAAGTPSVDGMAVGVAGTNAEVEAGARGAVVGEGAGLAGADADAAAEDGDTVGTWASTGGAAASTASEAASTRDLT